MSEPIRREEKKYSYVDYIDWPDDERWELIDGTAYAMTPAPSRIHQKIAVELLTIFHNYLDGRDCQVYIAPFDIRLPEGEESNEEVKTVVQPDIAVICDSEKLDDKGCKGSPDLIVEIISPSSLKRDIRDKFYLYERVGVKEYWIVYPEVATIVIYELEEDGKYGRPRIYSREDKVEVGIFPELVIKLEKVFEEKEKQDGVKEDTVKGEGKNES